MIISCGVHLVRLVFVRTPVRADGQNGSRTVFRRSHRRSRYEECYWVFRDR